MKPSALACLNTAINELNVSIEEGNQTQCDKLEALIAILSENPEPVDQITVDGEFVCENNVWVYKENVYTNGELTASNSTATEVLCDEPQPDIERVRVCDPATGTVHIVTSSTLNEVTTVLQDLDTEESCQTQCTKQLETWCTRTDINFVDNHSIADGRPLGPGVVAYPQDDHDITYTLSDGTVFSLTLPATGGGTWGPWNEAHAAALAAATGKPWVRGTQPSDGDITTFYGAAATVECCPGDVSLVSAQAMTVGGKRDGRTFPLAVGYQVGEVEEYTRCQCCGEAAEWYNSEGLIVEAPKCASKTCDFPAPPVKPVAECVGSTLGPVCHITPQVDADGNDLPPTQADVVTSGVYIELDCSGKVLTLFTIDPANPDQPSLYEITDSGYLGDCDTLAQVDPPTASCPETAVFEQVEYSNQFFILDNSNWTGSPTPHLQNGQNYEFTFMREDGTSTPVQLTADPYFNNFKTEVEAALNCEVVYVCANHTSAAGCNDVHAANLAGYGLTPDQAELWASGWLLDCAGCESPIVRVEISAATDPAYIGSFKEPTVHQGETVTAFRAVTCDNIFWKDCDGNDIEAPNAGCCAKPAGSSTPTGSVIDLPVCYETECVSIGLDGRYTTAPDAATDLTGVTISADAADGSEIIFLEDPVTTYTWEDYCQGGRLENLIASLNLGTGQEFSCQWVGEGELRIIWNVCGTDLQGVMIRFAGGDATVNGETGTITVAGKGTLLLDTETKQATCLLDSLGNELTEYTIVECLQDEPNDQSVIAVEVKCDTNQFVMVDGVKYFKQTCDLSGTVYKWTHETDDIAIIDEQTIVGGWAYVTNSAIDPVNCSVEAASVLPGTPPDPNLEPIKIEATEFERIKYRAIDGDLAYQDVKEDGDGGLIDYVPTGVVTECGTAKPDTMKLDPVCMEVDGETQIVVPVVSHYPALNIFTPSGYLDPYTGVQITGAVVKPETTNNCCEMEPLPAPIVVVEN